MAISVTDEDSLDVAGELLHLRPPLGDDYLAKALAATRTFVDSQEGDFLTEFTLCSEFTEGFTILEPARQAAYERARIMLFGDDDKVVMDIVGASVVVVNGETITLEDSEEGLVVGGLLNFRGHSFEQFAGMVRYGLRPLDFWKDPLFLPDEDDEKVRADRAKEILGDHLETGVLVKTGARRGSVYAVSPFLELRYVPEVVNEEVYQRLKIVHDDKKAAQQEADQQEAERVRLAAEARQAVIDDRERVAREAREAKEAVRLQKIADRQRAAQEAREAKEAVRLQKIQDKQNAREAARAARELEAQQAREAAEREAVEAERRRQEEERARVQAEREEFGRRNRERLRSSGATTPRFKPLVDNRASQLLADARSRQAPRESDQAAAEISEEGQEKEIQRLVRSQRGSPQVQNPITLERIVISIVCDDTRRVRLPSLRPQDRKTFRLAKERAKAQDVKKPGWQARLALLDRLEQEIWVLNATEEAADEDDD